MVGVTVFFDHNAQNRRSLAGLRGDVCRTSERGQEEELGGGVPRASVVRGTSLLGCAAGSALQRPQPHARSPGPADSSRASLEGSKLAIRGRPRPAPAVRGKSRIQRLLMPRESPPEVGDSSTWAAQPQSREGHRLREEGAAELGGRRRGHVSWRRARDEPFLSMWRRPDWARTTAVPPPQAAGSYVTATEGARGPCSQPTALRVQVRPGPQPGPPWPRPQPPVPAQAPPPRLLEGRPAPPRVPTQGAARQPG